MVCYDFIFDGKKLSDLDFIICVIGNNDTSWSGSDVTFTTIKPPGSNKVSRSNSQFSEQLSTTISIMKNPCKFDDVILTSDDQSKIMRWLQRTDGYHWLAFDEEWYEDIWYNAQINPQIEFVGGRPIGFTLNITTDSPYAYSQLKESKFSIGVGESVDLYDYSDLPGYIYPVVTITPKNSGNLVFKTGCSDYMVETSVSNVQKGIDVIFDKENDLVLGVDNLNNFNFKYPVLSNSFNNIKNTIVNIGDIDFDVKLEYRYIRRVVV